MRKFIIGAALGALAFVAQPAAAAIITLAFSGSIGPITTPARLTGGAFDGTIQFDDSTPFPNSPATLIVSDGPLASTYLFGAQPGAFIPAAYRVSYSDSAFTFRGTSDDGASVTFNLLGNRDAGYDGTFAFAKGADVAATGSLSLARGAITPVPEPSSWAMLIVGLGVIGLVTRKRRSSAYSVYA